MGTLFQDSASRCPTGPFAARVASARLAMALLAAPAAPVFAFESSLQRAPYVQNLGRTEVSILWRTTDSVTQTLEYGPKAAPYAFAVTEATPTREHEIRLTGLDPGTFYHYRVVENGIVRASGDDLRFITDHGRADDDFQFFVTGDIGANTSDAFQFETQAMIRTLRPRAEFGLLAGDIVYPDGDSDDYDEMLMQPWAELLCNTPVWPALGNHDWRSDPEKNFVKEWALPNNEHYYSFDYGSAHFIALDTMEGNLYEESEQLAWLEQDLATNDALWTFVFFHHPLITCTYKGNNTGLSEQLMPLFEQYGVDMVFTGHAHTYERLYPVRQGMPVHVDQDPYYQDPGAPVYVVSGSGGKIKRGAPTSYCGPTAYYLDERILFTQIYVRDHSVWLYTFHSLTGMAIDHMAIHKSPVPTDVGVAPPRARLLGNVPNPFNPMTHVTFELAKPKHVRLDVYGMDGTWVRRISERRFPAGSHRVRWSGVDAAGRSVPSGVYVVRMQTDGATSTHKVTLLR